MNKLFVPYYIAVKLRKKGFNEDCLAYYLVGVGPDNRIALEIGIDNDLETLIERVPAPLYQQVIDWFREKHKIFIEISPIDSWDNWVFRVYLEDIMSPFYSNPWNGEEYDSYHKAMIESINEALNYVQ